MNGKQGTTGKSDNEILVLLSVAESQPLIDDLKGEENDQPHNV
jgi:hypothetical protein